MYGFYLKKAGLPKAELCEKPPWKDAVFDLLLFDYGGVATLGAPGLAWSQCTEFLDHAHEHPGRYYIPVSYFTRLMVDELVKEAEETGNDIPANVLIGDHKETIAKAAILLGISS